MALFRRTSKGRHALGAAVTSIPSGPLQAHVPPPLAAPLPLPAQLPPVAPPPPETSWAPAVPEPDVMTSIAELIASGEAWSTEPAPPPTWREPVEVPAARAPVEPLAPPAVAPYVPEPVAYVPEPVVPEPAVPAPAFVPPPVVAAPVVAAAPPPPAVPARTALEAALADLLPVQPDGVAPTGPPREAAFVPTPAEPRVQLGFRDGTSTSLDPSSAQSRALQELAQTLTRRD